MLKIKENLMAKQWDERMASLPKEIVEKINAPIGKEQLIKLKRSKEPVQIGDIFILSPAENIYFYGKVLEANIRHITGDDWFTGSHVVFIFKCKSRQKTMDNYYEDYKAVLIGPKIVTSDYWQKGLFETIGNIPLSKTEEKLDYGFFDMEPLGRWGSFKKANGEEMDHEPKFYQSYGVSTLTAVYNYIRDEIIINPGLLKI